MRTAAIVATLCLPACYGGAPTEAGDGTDGATGSGSADETATASPVDTGGTSGGGEGDDGSDDGDDASSGGSADTGEPDEPTSDPLDGLPTGVDQWELLCARGHTDAIANAFCAGDAPPQVSSLEELLDLIGLGFIPGNLENGENGNPGFTLAYHSTAVSTRFVNAINPRSFVFTPPIGGVVFPPSGISDPNLVMMAFTRGEPFVELVANDPVDDELRFYLFRFVSPCENTVQGCDNADLLTPAIESDFEDYSLYTDADIGNTVLDCLQCHQAGGPGTPKMLRMQEFEEGWTHWYYPNRAQNREAMQQFVDTHQGESYGGIPAEFLTQQMLLENGEGSAVPLAMEQVVRNQGFATQPNEFPSQQIIAERNNAGCTCNNCPNPPPMDPTNSCSPTWDALFAASVQSQAIAAPYFDGHIADPAKVATASQAYQATMAGDMPGNLMPDIRDVLYTEGLPYMSFAPAPGLDGREILTHMCQHCHNSSLDPTISRANFDIEDFDALPQSVKNEAIRRLELPDDDIERMPPTRFHTLSQDEVDLVVDVLSP